ncbi:MAG: NAD(P)-dependent oxidoreductase [Deltaproteobacteria bacterium]|nr:NAD(P)-dependent oxidoreductase [Deltaproteobacteria bacterium]
MKIFLTGGSGFLGSHIAEAALGRGHEVAALVRETSNLGFLKQLGVNLHFGELRKPESVIEGLKGCEAVIHSAGLIKAKSLQEYIDVNVKGTADLLEMTACCRPSLKRFVYISSIAAQGPSPSPEPRGADLEPRTVSHYGESKLLGEKEALKYVGKFPVTVIRPPIIYGERDSEFLTVFKLIRRLRAITFMDGRQIVSMIHAADAAIAALMAVETEHPSGSIFPVDDGEGHTYQEMGKTIGRAMGVNVHPFKIPLAALKFTAFLFELYGRITSQAVVFNMDKVNEAKQLYWVCGHEEIAKRIGWKPEISLTEGAKRTAEWYAKNGLL